MGNSKGRILVVDDDALNRIKLSTNLEEDGCEVELAKDGEQALKMLGGGSYDTVLLDLMMPVMDGFAVLEHVQNHNELQHIPFIVISAEEDMNSIVRCIEMGAADYLPKPFNPTLLRARVGACLEKKRSRDREQELFAELQERYQQLRELNQTIQEQADLLKEVSIRDELTRLYNRRHFNEQAAREFAQSQRHGHPLTMMIGDIDHFKRINDTFSHATGDDVLRQVARVLQDNTREGDILARYGGEEFVIALPQTDLEQAATVCEKLRLAIESHAWHEIHPDLRVTMSMGLNSNIQLSSYDKMIDAADELLYKAKESGRNRVCAS
ncbi:MAG TPA: diguanylate cyclase [Abditibacteriaceae bacterium]|jgi:diguanylate cyclase (GGDEF)-like protein